GDVAGGALALARRVAAEAVDAVAARALGAGRARLAVHLGGRARLVRPAEGAGRTVGVVRARGLAGRRVASVWRARGEGLLAVAAAVAEVARGLATRARGRAAHDRGERVLPARAVAVARAVGLAGVGVAGVLRATVVWVGIGGHVAAGAVG